ncbi:MAG TPA: hypothetical protein PLE19_01870 [Planctomycetota bacterium]|nr:hypothetical protein [Planctomycetota bacterium]HRR78688.1 hypothetical protein [Planctomycetota bacterium]HRT93356.1 hypothetical protein [Planctomycetota bacterium]
MATPGRHVLLAAALVLARAGSADITVQGTVYYWNGHERAYKVDDTLGAWKAAANTQVQVENDCLAVGDVTTYTDWTGQYKVTFQQRFFRPDFNHLRVNIEVRAQVLLEKDVMDRQGRRQDITVACYKTNYILGLDLGGLARIFPYNGQTDSVYIRDGETRTLNVYVGPKECPDPPAPTIPGWQNLRVTSWDYDDDGRRTTAALFMTQCCDEAYRFLVRNCADKKELRRSTSLFYPANKSAYIFKPQKGAWIDIGKADLFRDEEARDEERWWNWQALRCTMLHEYGHKLMHDIYWTLPKPYPWGHGGNPFSDEANDHDPLACKTEEMGLCEGWADFLPAVLQRSPTLKGERVFVYHPAGLTHDGYNIEHAWYPGMPRNSAQEGYLDAGGNVAWRGDVKGRREWNETEVAAVLWDVHDTTGWEYMPQSQQDAKPAAWPADLMWFDRVCDFKLERIWAILREEPECLNDEDEMEVNRDSFWTFWLAKYGGDRELVHGLKAILHNREMPHKLRPQNAPQIVSVRVLPGCSTVLFADVTVKESDEEDRPFLYYNVAYGKGTDPLKLLHQGDRPLEGEWAGDQLVGRLRLPPRGDWDRLIVKVHDSMTCAFAQSGDATWQDDSAGSGPRLRLIDANGGEYPDPRIAAIGPGGTVWTWGNSQVGCPTLIARDFKQSNEWRSRANQTPGLSGVVALACIQVGHYVALKSDGTVWTWGTADSGGGALGIGDAKPAPDRAPNLVPGLSDVVAVDAGIGNSFALKADGTVWAWGFNGSYNLGDGTRERRKSPVQVQGLEKKIKAISTATGGFTLAVDEDGEVWVWGDPPLHVLNPRTGPRELSLKKPEKVPCLRDIVDVCAGTPSLALDKQGAVWEIGSTDYFTGAKHSPEPGRVPGLPKIIAIAGRGSPRVALAEDSQIWTWARTNEHGQLGNPKRQKPEDCIKPAPLDSIRGWVAIAAGVGFGAAVHQQGYAVTWGLGKARGDGQREDTDAVNAVKTHTYRVPSRPGEDPEFRPIPLWLFH